MHKCGLLSNVVPQTVTTDTGAYKVGTVTLSIEWLAISERVLSQRLVTGPPMKHEATNEWPS